MARTLSPDRLTNTEAAAFRRLMLRVMKLKGLGYSDIAQTLLQADFGDGEDQWVRNRLKLGPRPVLAPDARAIWQAVAVTPSCRGFDGTRDGSQELLQGLWPRPAWMERYALRRAGPGVIIPPGEVSAFAAMIAARVARTRAARGASQRKIESLLKGELIKMASRWRDLAEEYACVVAASASRGEYIWQDRLTGKDVIRRVQRTSKNPNNHDVLIVRETIALLAGDARGLRANKKGGTKLRETTKSENHKVITRFDGDARAAFEPFMPPGSAEADPLRVPGTELRPSSPQAKEKPR